MKENPSERLTMIGLNIVLSLLMEIAQSGISMSFSWIDNNNNNIRLTKIIGAEDFIQTDRRKNNNIISAYGDNIPKANVENFKSRRISPSTKWIQWSCNEEKKMQTINLHHKLCGPKEEKYGNKMEIKKSYALCDTNREATNHGILFVEFIFHSNWIRSTSLKRTCNAAMISRPYFFCSVYVYWITGINNQFCMCFLVIGFEFYIIHIWADYIL